MLAHIPQRERRKGEEEEEWVTQGGSEGPKVKGLLRRCKRSNKLYEMYEEIGGSPQRCRTGLKKKKVENGKKKDVEAKVEMEVEESRARQESPKEKRNRKGGIVCAAHAY